VLLFARTSNNREILDLLKEYGATE
jgi:hypothetical protein